MILATRETLTKTHPWLYVLACQGNTFYVGFSRYLHNRLKMHWMGMGAFFTREHKPLRVLEIRPATSEKDEYVLWQLYARKYGVARVGGYSPRICKQLGFKWERIVPITRAKYSPLGESLFLPKVLDTSFL